MANDGPSWLGIGSQRSGTTWFTDLLMQHPMVDVGDGMKEHHVLYRYGLMRDWNTRTRRKYRKTFDSDGAKLGEFTPYYLRSPWTPEVAKDALNEGTPLIVLFRDPVDRFASALRHAMGTAVRRYKKHLKKQSEGGEKVNKYFPRPLPKIPKDASDDEEKDAYFDQVRVASSVRWIKGPPKKAQLADRTWLRHVGSDTTWGGMYATHMDAWISTFPKEQFIVIQYEKLRRDPQHYTDLVWRRLGLDPVPLADIDKRSSTSTQSDKWLPDDHPDVVRGLQRMYRPDAERLAADWDIDLSLWKRTMNDV